MVGQHRSNVISLEKAGYKVIIREDKAVDYLKVLME